MGLAHYSIQLQDHRSGEIIETAGGACYVAQAGLPDKQTVKDKTGATVTNPVALTNGRIDFYVDDTVASVDLYVQGPSGHFVVAKTVKPSGPNEIMIDQGVLRQVAVIPFSVDDTTATTETDTGFDLPTNARIDPTGVGVRVTTVDATETIDVGLLSTESGGDANGLVAALSVATAGFVLAKPTLTAGGSETYYASTTLGALLVTFLAGADTATDVGTHERIAHVGNGTAKSFSYTLTAGTDTAEGFIVIPYDLSVPV